MTSEERLEGKRREPSRYLEGNVSGRERDSQCKGPEAHELSEKYGEVRTAEQSDRGSREGGEGGGGRQDGLSQDLWAFDFCSEVKWEPQEGASGEVGVISCSCSWCSLAALEVEGWSWEPGRRPSGPGQN